MREMYNAFGTPWILVGFAGQIAFSLRFLVQWIASERARRSVVPLSFWYFSLVGSALLLTYALIRKDPVFILGQLFGGFIYTRNLVLVFRSERENRE